MYFFLPLLPHLHVLSSSWYLSTWLPAGWFMQDKPGSRASPGEQPGQRWLNPQTFRLLSHPSTFFLPQTFHL